MACTTAGLLSAGADCDTAYSHQKKQLTFEEWIAFLEPSANKPGAICMTAEDYTAEITELEQACSLTNNACEPPVTNAIAHMRYRLNYLKKRSLFELKNVPQQENYNEKKNQETP